MNRVRIWLASVSKIGTLSLLILSLLLTATCLMIAFLVPLGPVHVNPLLASLSCTEKSWSIYPDDYYPSGGYVEFQMERCIFDDLFFFQFVRRCQLVSS